MVKLNNCFWMFMVPLSVVLFSSWEGREDSVVGPIPEAPDYADTSQWYIRDRGGEADIFYIISTETGDHLMGGDTCHLADTYQESQRKRMLKEMHAVDSFYSGRLNYYSPYYRQVSIQSWLVPQKVYQRLPVSMADVKRSWQYYLKHYNQGRPFIIAGYSQGAIATMDILRDMPDSIYRRMVAAYVIGYKITHEDIDSFPCIKPAQGATDTGVTVAFNSVRRADDALYITKGTVACINPVNWRTDSVPAELIYRSRRGNDTLTVCCDTTTKHLIVEGWKKETIMPLFGVPGCYHHMELKFYYRHIRKNIADRVAAFYDKKRKVRQ